MFVFMAEGGFNPLAIESGYMFWSVLTFLITLAILYKLGWKPLGETIENREKKIREDIEKAELARAEAEKSMEAHKAQLAEAAADARKMIEEAREAGERSKESILSEAREQSAALKAQAERDIATARDKALAEIKKHVVEVAMAVSRKIVADKVDEEEHRKLVDQALSRSKDVA